MKLKLMKFGTAAIVCALLPFGSAVHGGTHVWTGAGGSSWNSDFNWSSGGKPVVGEAPPVILVFPPAGAKLTTNDIPGLLVDQVQITGDTYRIGASGGAVLTFNTNAAFAISNAPSCDTTIGANVALLGQTRVKGDGSVVFLGAISGAGGFTVSGPLTTIAGNPVNSFTGPTIVENGHLQLSKSNGPAILGDLTIGYELGANNNEVVRYLRSHQVSDTSAVLVKGTGLLDLNGNSDTVGTITLRGGEIETDSGLLTLNANVTVEIHPDQASIDGRLNLGSRSKTFTVASNAWLDVTATISGATDVGFGKSGPGFMSLDNSNSFSGPVTVSAGVLGIFDPRALGTTNWATTVSAGATLELLYSGLTGEPLTLNGAGHNDEGALALSGLFDQTIFTHITLGSAATINVASNLTLIMKGTISGPGALHKAGDGILWFDGGAANTFTGGTYVDAGELILGKASYVISLPGPLFVGDNLGGLNSDVVRLLDHGQIFGNATIVVNSSGLLEIDQYTQGCGSLALHGSARVNVNPNGVLNLPPLVTFDGDNAIESESSPGMYKTPAITGDGRAHLQGATEISSEWANGIYPHITGGPLAHIFKTGDGHLGINGSNSYAGATIIREGSLGISDSHALGSPAGSTIVTNSGYLIVGYHITVPEPLILAGNNQNEAKCSLTAAATNTWTGPITILSNSVVKASTFNSSGKLRITGVISGGGTLIKKGEDPVELAGTNSNTHYGNTIVAEGLLLLNKTNATAIAGTLTVGDGTNSPAADEVRLLGAGQISDSSVVEVKQFGTLNLNSFSETIGSLQGHGTVNTLLGTLTAGGNNFTTTFGGVIGGVGFTSFVKQGSGTMLFTGTNAALGKTIVVGGKLFAHGAISAPVVVSNNGTLGGNGAVGNVLSTNGVVNPGAGTGMLETKGLALDALSSVRIEIDGTNAGSSYDQIRVAGAVALGNATLNATLDFASAISNQFVIIDNDGSDAVVGTFAGLAEGAATMIGGATFKISYTGGTGNDVVLTQTSPLPQAVISGVTPLPGGQIKIGGQGVPGTTYNVVANTNLNTLNWIFIGTCASAPINGNMSFTDTNAMNFPMRFYKFVLP